MSASHLFVFDGSSADPITAYNTHSATSDMASSDADLQFYSDCLNPFPDSPIDILQALSDDSNNQNPPNPDVPTANILSSSPPSSQLQNLSLTQLQTLADASSSANGFADFSAFEVKTEENHLNFEPASAINPSFLYAENAVKLMQRSFSSNSFDGKPGILLQPHFDTLLDAPYLHTQDSNLCNGHMMRRVCSTGDLQVKDTEVVNNNCYSSTTLVTDRGCFMDEVANFKVGRYSAEERKERIHRYRAKRTQRNFNKTIKYACRKTLADNRPRIRGRFARNDEPVETPKTTCSNRFEEDEEIWIDGLHEEGEDGGMRIGGAFFNSFGQTQFQYYTTTTAINN